MRSVKFEAGDSFKDDSQFELVVMSIHGDSLVWLRLFEGRIINGGCYALAAAETAVATGKWVRQDIAYDTQLKLTQRVVIFQLLNEHDNDLVVVPIPALRRLFSYLGRTRLVVGIDAPRGPLELSANQRHTSNNSGPSSFVYDRMSTTHLAAELSRLEEAGKTSPETFGATSAVDRRFLTLLVHIFNIAADPTKESRIRVQSQLHNVIQGELI